MRLKTPVIALSRHILFLIGAMLFARPLARLLADYLTYGQCRGRWARHGFGSGPLTGLELLRKESAELPDGPSFVTFIGGNVGAPAPFIANAGIVSRYCRRYG